MFAIKGFQQITVGTSTAVSSLTIPADTQACRIHVSAAPVRMRADGTAPSGTIGEKWATESVHQINFDPRNIKLVKSSTGGSPVVNVHYLG